MIQVYTGNGKGKTTAAIGLAIRAAGAGLNVYIAQFAKGRRYSEINALRKISKIKIEQFGRSCFIKRAPDKADFKLAERGLKKVDEIIEKGKY
jgi:cob(I)alamin adenosyltransferase